MEYNIIFSNRRTISLSIKNGVLTVKAPFGTKEKRIEELLKKHERWIEKHLARTAANMEKYESLSFEEVKKLKAAAKEYFSFEIEKFSKIMGLNYGRMTITSAKTRFGSCSSKKNICFSYRLMLYPEAAREYVVVHELCHRKQMNHSPRFYEEVEKVFPDYKRCRKWLKENGSAYMRRLTK